MLQSGASRASWPALGREDIVKAWLRTAALAVPMVSCALAISNDARGICRIVEPTVESGMAPVEFDPTTVAVYVYAPDQIVGYECPTGDGGVEMIDAGELMSFDAGADGGPDADVVDASGIDAGGGIPQGAGG